MNRRLEGHYFDLLRRMHETVRPRTYLEIGVHTGRSLELAVPETLIVGVDPVPAVWSRINETAKLFFETSDDFFAHHDVRALFGDLDVDMAFIDGMHLFEYVLRDFRNVEASCNAQSLVLVHDCFPLDADAADRERGGDAWTGDTWKLVPCLRELRPDLEIVTVAVRPSGLTMIRNLDPTNRVLFDRYDEAIARFGKLDFAVIEGRQEEALNVIPNDWDEVARHLPAGPLTRAGAGPAVRRRRPLTWPVVRHQAVRRTKLAGRKLLSARAKA